MLTLLTSNLQWELQNSLLEYQSKIIYLQPRRVLAQISHPRVGLIWPHHVAKMIIVLLLNSVPSSSIVATISNTVLTLLPNYTIVAGILKDGYVCNVPLPRVPQIQSASPTRSHESIAPKAGITLPGYLHIPRWIPTLPKLGSILGFSQRLLWPFSPIALKATNNLLS